MRARLRRWLGRADAPSPAPAIDVKKLIAEMSDEDLVRGADAYFSQLTPDSMQYKKPFYDPVGTAPLAQNLGLLFEAANLFRGARVLDFGCGTGWLSLGLAQAGCDVVGADISQAALQLAERLKSEHHVKGDGRLDFQRYDGTRLPMPDASFDRVVCFDAFHHVKDQRATLEEFARVLKPGGRVAFVEPGPEHSRTAQSQLEMASFKVIENDIVLNEIAEHAVACGLSPPEVLVQWQRPLRMPVAQFTDWGRKGIPLREALAIARGLSNEMVHRSCFYLDKGEPVLDSRQLASLGGALQLLQVAPTELKGLPAFKVSLSVRNTGRGPWLTGRHSLGRVGVGCQLNAADGTFLNTDYGRLPLGGPPVDVGQERLVEGVLLLPNHSAYTLRFDLVAERVAWFSQVRRAEALHLSAAQLHQHLARAA